MAMILLALGLAAAAAPGIPPAYAGEWQRARSQCGSAQEHRIVVAGDTLDFYEARFRVRSTRRIDRNTVALRGTWSEDGASEMTTLRLALAPSGRSMTVTAPNWVSRVVACR